MAWLGVAVAMALIVIVFIDAFEVTMLPRRVSHDYRLARLYYRSAWVVWRIVARLFPARRRHSFLGVFGPFSLFGLLGVWASGLIFGFAFLHWWLDTAKPKMSPEAQTPR